MSGGLAEEDRLVSIVNEILMPNKFSFYSSLNRLIESSKQLGTMLLDFISQCQSHPEENYSMEIRKRGKLVPLPERCLVFDNGRVSEWSGK